MKLNAFRAALSVMSGRVDVGELSSAQRSELGIEFDPKNSVRDRDAALRCVEQSVEDVVFLGEAHVGK